MPPLSIMIWHWGRRGGGPRYMLELVRGLQERDDVSVHVSYSRQAEIAADFTALNLPAFPVDTYHGLASAALSTVRLPALIARFRRYLTEHRIDVVVCAMSHPWNVLVAPMIAAAGVRYLLTLHDALPHPGEESRLRMWALARELRYADGIIALTRHVRDQLVTLHGYPAERTFILPHGVFTFGQSAPRSLPPDGPVRLMFFGRILPYKGVDLLLDAYDRLRRRYGTRVTLEIAGSGDLGPYTERLNRLEGVIIHNRWIAEEEIGGFLERADLLILPYREASQSGVIPSAYAMAVPVVATAVGGLAEQVIDGETGRLAARADADVIADMAAAIIDDPDGYRRLSAQALNYARGTLSWSTIAEGLVGAARRHKS